MQLKLHMVTIEDLVPEGHFLRKLEATLDLSFIHEETSHLYNRRYGRPAVDPAVLVKYLLVGYLCGIPSERQIEQRIQTDVALWWYLGLDLFDRVPDHSTISQLRRRKPSFRKVFRRLFEEVVRQCIEKGLVSGRLAATEFRRPQWTPLTTFLWLIVYWRSRESLFMSGRSLLLTEPRRNSNGMPFLMMRRTMFPIAPMGKSFE